MQVLKRGCAVAMVALSMSGLALAAASAEEFPFGMEMTLDALPMPGSKRVPDLDIGDNGDTVLELWCKGGKGQFSVAGNTIVFIAGKIEDRNCPAARAQADDELIAALSAVTNWKRQGDLIIFVGPKTLRFRLNTN
ncbi:MULTISPECIES: META domain-containing protein [unclassified Bradyrhizobium]|uniref:META domain-containing protein n=1 Tax=unclassified Bradyrhizobium TaxID=2631580 RepID=UPI0028E88B93|nr:MULTISPECIES: META domain-containing protein [unclassified Bradyrhizobium]